ncbi:aldose 1-epimerase family protein [Phreatobacter cathodiphilus]|uniref:Aldose epimerase n=1 Tax=Phreatobacter cathodiphilus TaxID=1868589 RepID=A0A2S0NEF4_9HYPH|nr:aldose 1-epimerase family protein [Phreatobacter cathodiphilus]AVO46554.1 aldose epimerase [Phreatobacter cathodiphilus]
MITLVRDGQRAVVSPLGAELKAWSVDGNELLWPGDAAWWSASAPVLFPIVGWARDGMIRVDGVARPMGVHGFAAASRFRQVAGDGAASTLELGADDATFAIYPFPFRLSVTHALTDAGLVTELAVANEGDRPMPYALGLHPGFRWPLSGNRRAGHAVIFAEPEEPSVPVIAPGGLFSPERRPVPLDGRGLALTDALFAAEALCFLGARSTSWTLEAPDGARLTMALEGFPHLALWSKPGAPFVCLEAWTGHGDPVGFSGDLADKPSMRLLAPGATDSVRMSLAFTPR